jgi:hypothetical protein
VKEPFTEERKELLGFVHAAWEMQPPYVAKEGPTFCNLSGAVKRECSCNDILNDFSSAIAFFLNGNRLTNENSKVLQVRNEVIKVLTLQGKNIINNNNNYN